MDFQTKLLNSIRQIPNFPQDGVLFRDITTLLNDNDMFNELILHLKERYEKQNIDFVAGIESRGFIFGAALASELKKGFVPIRKAGKLPYTTISQHYALEYGTAKIEMHIDAFRDIKNPRVLLIDDLIATGGTAIASTKLIKQLNAHLVEACFIIDLVGLGGTKALSKECKIYSVLSL